MSTTDGKIPSAAAPEADKPKLNANAKAFTPGAASQKAAPAAAPAAMHSNRSTPSHAPQHKKMPAPMPMMMPGAQPFMPMPAHGHMPMNPGMMLPGQMPFGVPPPPVPSFMSYPMPGGMGMAPMGMPMPGTMPMAPPQMIGKMPPPMQGVPFVGAPGALPYSFMPQPLPVQMGGAPAPMATPPQSATPPRQSGSQKPVGSRPAQAPMMAPFPPAEQPMPAAAQQVRPLQTAMPVPATRAIPSMVSAPVPSPAAVVAPTHLQGPVAAAATITPPRVSVGNASLAALSANEVPKFSCVLLSGLPAAGKTTMGRELVNSLQEDGRGWTFFSGADFLQDERTKRSVWETTKEVFDALSKRLDDLLQQQREHRNLRGVVIDKNCKGIEDIYYLSALLKSKNIPFVGIVGMEVEDENVLINRMGGDSELREKLKYHRVIHARVVSLAKAVGMYRYVDASQPKAEVVQTLRTRVLGCVAQPSMRGIRTHHYDDSKCNSMVDDYREYAEVLDNLFKRVNTTRGFQFPAAADFAPFSTKEMADKNRITAYRSRYGVRRDVEGMRFLLMYHNKKLYLIPPHMRAVLEMPSKAWLGTKLQDVVGSFVLEGDLTRMLKEKHKEMFLAYDTLFWSDVEDPATNAVMRMSWANRQTLLASHLVSEVKAFYPPDVPCVVAHHVTEHMDKAIDLLEPTEYESNGLVFQPITTTHRTDQVLAWRQPSNVTVNFRVGALDKAATEADAALNGSATAAGSNTGLSPRKLSTGAAPASLVVEPPLRTYALEVYDKNEKRYVQFNGATVSLRHLDVVEGCIISCSIKDEARNIWLFHRIRYDVLRPIYKHELDHLLETCLVPRVKLVSWLIAEDLVNTEIPKDSANTRWSAGSGPNRNRSSPAAPSGPAPSYAAVVSGASGPAHATPPPSYNVATASTGTIVSTGASASSAGAPGREISDEQIKVMLANIVGSVHVVKSESGAASKPAAVSGASAGALAASASPAVVSAGTSATEAAPSSAARASRDAAALTEVPASCAQCNRKKAPEDLRFDRREKKFYCYACWQKSGYGFCTVCGEFKEGNKETRGRSKGSFVCRNCAGKSSAGAARDGAGRNGGSREATDRKGGAGKERKREPTKKNAEEKPARGDEGHAEKKPERKREPREPREGKEPKEPRAHKERKSEAPKAADGAAATEPKKEGKAKKTSSARDTAKADSPKRSTPTSAAPKAEAPTTEAPKAEAPETEAPKAEAPKTEAPKAEAPRTDAVSAKPAEPSAGENALKAESGAVAPKKGGCTQQ